MEIAIISDIHDALKNLESALNLFEKERIQTILFCGDFCSPIPCRLLKSYPGTIHCVFGNGDGDRWQMMNIASNGEKNLFLHGEYAALDLEGKKIGLTHYPFYAGFMARSGDFDAVFSGHTHVALTEELGNTLHANPGDIMGWKNPPSAGIWDTQSAKYRQIEIG